MGIGGGAAEIEGEAVVGSVEVVDGSWTECCEFRVAIPTIIVTRGTQIFHGTPIRKSCLATLLVRLEEKVRSCRGVLVPVGGIRERIGTGLVGGDGFVPCAVGAWIGGGGGGYW